MVSTKLNMILTNLHMVDIPYAREVSGTRESKVIKLSHTLLHLSLGHMDELDTRACCCASHRKVLTIVCLLTTLAITPLFKAPPMPSTAPLAWEVANWS